MVENLTQIIFETFFAFLKLMGQLGNFSSINWCIRVYDEDLKIYV